MKGWPHRLTLALSDKSKRILAYAAEESERLNTENIDIQHLLLGILLEEKCIAAQVLRGYGLKLDDLREWRETETERKDRQERFREEEWQKTKRNGKPRGTRSLRRRKRERGTKL